MSHPSVMVLDDDEATLELVPYILKRELPGLVVEPVQSPLMALARLQARDYGVLLTDLCMPEMNGLSVLTKATALCPETAVVLVSSQPKPESVTHALQRGACDFLPKSVSREE